MHAAHSPKGLNASIRGDVDLLYESKSIRRMRLVTDEDGGRKLGRKVVDGPRLGRMDLMMKKLKFLRPVETREGLRTLTRM